MIEGWKAIGETLGLSSEGARARYYADERLRAVVTRRGQGRPPRARARDLKRYAKAWASDAA